MITKPYEFFIGLRYLKAKRRRRTISLNTFISISGVTLGVAALIATLAVMTGFKEDLRDKILGTNAHVIITDRTSNSIKDYPGVIAKVEQLPHVLAATPFIYNQVLLSSEAAVHGVVLRGVDPRSEARVTDIQKNLVDGRLEALDRKAPAKDDKNKTLPGVRTVRTCWVGTVSRYGIPIRSTYQYGAQSVAVTSTSKMRKKLL